MLNCRNLGEGLTNLLSDKQKLTAAVGGLTVLALGIYTSKEGTRVAGRAVDRCVFKGMQLSIPFQGQLTAGSVLILFISLQLGLA